MRKHMSCVPIVLGTIVSLEPFNDTLNAESQPYKRSVYITTGVKRER